MAASSTLPKPPSGKLTFLAHIVPAFAASYKMSVPDAYAYLQRYGGFDYLCECWWALHCDNPVWALHDIYLVCRSNGGMR